MDIYWKIYDLRKSCENTLILIRPNSIRYLVIKASDELDLEKVKELENCEANRNKELKITAIKEGKRFKIAFGKDENHEDYCWVETPDNIQWEIA